MSEKAKLNPDDYQPLDWPTLQHMSESGVCPCCGNKFSQEMPMEMASKCHPGSPVWAQYWDGVLFFKCSVCEQPMCKVEVSKSLLADRV